MNPDNKTPTNKTCPRRRGPGRTLLRWGALLSMLSLGLVATAQTANAEDVERLTVRARVTYRDSSRIEIKPISGPAASIEALWDKKIDVTSTTRITTLDGKNRLRSLRAGSSIVDIEVVVRPRKPDGGGPGLGCGITITGKTGCGTVWEGGGSYQRGAREAVTITQVSGSCIKSTAELGEGWSQSPPETALCRVRGSGTDELVVTINAIYGDKLKARLPGTEAHWQWGGTTVVTPLTQISPSIYTASTSVQASTTTNTKFSVYWFGDAPDDGDSAKLYKLFVNKRLK